MNIFKSCAMSFSKISVLWQRSVHCSSQLASRTLSSSSISNPSSPDNIDHDASTSSTQWTPQLTQPPPNKATPIDSFDYPLVAPSSHVSPSFMNDPLSMKFINCMMKDGKKSLSQTIFRKAMEIVKTAQLKKLRNESGSGVAVETDPLAVFHTALKNVTPILGTKAVKKGGRTYQVPTPLHENRRRFLSIKWLIMAAREGKGHKKVKKMPERLAAEILEAYNNQGAAVKRKQDMNRLAEANKAFVHFRW